MNDEKARATSHSSRVVKEIDYMDIRAIPVQGNGSFVYGKKIKRIRIVPLF